MNARRFGFTLLGTASVAVVIGAGAAATGTAPPWLDALNARSEGLNQTYGLGQERRTLGSPGPDWLRALRARSAALNQEYGLGDFGRQTARSTAKPDWLAALEARSIALNRMYGLPTRDTSSAGR